MHLGDIFAVENVGMKSTKDEQVHEINLQRIRDKAQVCFSFTSTLLCPWSLTSWPFPIFLCRFIWHSCFHKSKNCASVWRHDKAILFLVTVHREVNIHCTICTLGLNFNRPDEKSNLFLKIAEAKQERTDFFFKSMQCYGT